MNSLRLLALVLLAGCTSLGAHDQAALRQLDFGAKDTVALCLYLDEGISEARARALIDEAWRDEAPLYGLEVKVASVTRWRRPAFMMDGIIGALRREPLAQRLGPHDQLHAEPHHEDDRRGAGIAEGLELEGEAVRAKSRHGTDRGTATRAIPCGGMAATRLRAARAGRSRHTTPRD